MINSARNWQVYDSLKIPRMCYRHLEYYDNSARNWQVYDSLRYLEFVTNI